MGVAEAAIAVAAISAVAAASEAGASYAQSVRQEKMAKNQEKAAKIQQGRDIADLERRRMASASSLKAALAASGQLNTASSDVLRSTDASVFGVEKARLLQDYSIQGGVLQARTKEYGTQSTGALMKGTFDVAGAGARGYQGVTQGG